MEEDTEVINSHMASDAAKKRDSNPVDNSSNNRGMQDSYHNPSKHIGWSKGQHFKGPPNAKKTRNGESGPSHAGTSHNNYSNLQEPQRRNPKGSQGPQYPPKYVTQKSFGLSKGPKVQITPLPFTLTPPPTHTTHPNTYTQPPNHHPHPGSNPNPHHTNPQSYGPPPTDPCLPTSPPNNHPTIELNPFPQTPGFAPYAHATYTQQPPYPQYPPPHTPQPLPNAPHPYPPPHYSTHTGASNPPQKSRALKNQKSIPYQNK